MTRLVLASAAAAISVLLTGCGGDGTDVASDPPPSTTEATPTGSPTATYPPFEPEDYTYTLVLACFCAGGGTPIDVTVRDGEVVDAVYDGDGRGVEAGTPADRFMWLTITDVIDAANDATAAGAASVQVEWPAGQDHPTSVYVDQDTNMVDEEIGYHVSHVVVG
jgi:Family of unknown function (DUF6174)